MKFDTLFFAFVFGQTGVNHMDCLRFYTWTTSNCHCARISSGQAAKSFS